MPSNRVSAAAAALLLACAAAAPDASPPPSDDPVATEAVCGRLAAFVLRDGASAWPGGNTTAWYSDAAMPQLGVAEVARLFPDIARNATPWLDALVDSFTAPGGRVSQLRAGADWGPWCDRDGVPPAVILAANRTGRPGDAEAVAELASQALSYPREGRCQGLGALPSGAVARSTAGGWKVPPLPKGNATQVTWPDDTFMCTATLSHAGASLGRVDLVDEAARRALALLGSPQRDAATGLVWHGYDAATGAHSCCKWGDGNGWLLMGLADIVKAYAAIAASSGSGGGSPSGTQPNGHGTQPIPPASALLRNQTLAAFQDFAEAWLRVQDISGMWRQLLDDTGSYLCSSATGFATYSLATGVVAGALPAERFAAPVASAWRALSALVRPDGFVGSLSPGFGILGTREAYLARSNSSIMWGYGAVVRACAAVATVERRRCGGWLGGIDRGHVLHGNDIGSIGLPDGGDPMDGIRRCADACCVTPGCHAWTTGPSDQKAVGGACRRPGAPCCWLKNAKAPGTPRFPLNGSLPACGVAPNATLPSSGGWRP